MNTAVIKQSNENKIKPISCYVFGLGSLLKLCTQQLLANNRFDVLGFISADEDAIQWANKQGIKTLHLVDKVRYDLSADKIQRFLHNQQFDYFFSIVNAMKLPTSIINLPRKMAINFHDSELPKYAGVDATSWAIMKQEPVHAVTWHSMSNEIDEGEIVLQQLFPIENDDTAFTLNGKCFEAGVQSFSRLIRNIETNEIETKVQDLTKRSYYSRYKPFTDPDLEWNYGIIDWQKSAESIDALIRSLNFGQYRNSMLSAKVKFPKQYVLVGNSEITPDSSSKPAGTIVSIQNGKVVVSTLTKDLAIYNLRFLDGRVYNIHQENDVLRLNVGFQLAYDAPDKTELYQLDKQCLWNERYWADKIAKTRQSNSLSTDVSLQSKNKIYSIHLPDNKGLFLNEWDSQVQLLALYVIVISAKNNNSNVAVWSSQLELYNKFSKYSALFSLYFPSIYEINYGASLTNLIENVDREWKEVMLKAGFHHDLLHRFVELRSEHGWLKYNDFGFSAFSEHESIEHDYLFGMKLHSDTSCSNINLIVDTARFNSVVANQYSNAISFAIKNLKKWAESSLSVLEIVHYLKQYSNIENYQDVAAVLPNGSSEKDNVSLLSDIWCETLGVCSVEDNQNFFNSGDSITAMQFVQRFNLLTGRSIPLSYIYKKPNFSDWIELI
ncbi:MULTISPECIES: formyltransferase family protein [Dickeya]|uniref:Non-ribosomal peptide synthetase n=1 Tax=Dickeya aquatica TaxID=1401087 RepID=A0A375A9Q0_9GAMM|nr:MULTISPECIES: formyltransferase family protein [Dickeya]SLM62745.1 Non-ribosomal peptide synthetase [Dickeya aquatica]